MATKKTVLGRGIRLYVANKPNPTLDTDWTRVSNETSIEINEKADEEKIETKEVLNKFSEFGAVEVTMKAELIEVFDDAGQALLPLIGKSALMQVRDDNNPAAVRVIAEGPFAAVDRTFKAVIKGATTWSYSLSAAGEVNTVPRLLSETPPAGGGE